MSANDDILEDGWLYDIKDVYRYYENPPTEVFFNPKITDPSSPYATPQLYRTLLGVRILSGWTTENWKTWFYALKNKVGQPSAVFIFSKAANHYGELVGYALPKDFNSPQFTEWKTSVGLSSKIVGDQSVITEFTNWIRNNGTTALVVGGVLIASVTLLPWAKMGAQLFSAKPTEKPKETS